MFNFKPKHLFRYIGIKIDHQCLIIIQSNICFKQQPYHVATEFFPSNQKEKVLSTYIK